MIYNVFREFAAQAEGKDLQLRMRVPDVAIYSDPLLFERIVRNVVANAVTMNGGVLIGCRRRGDSLRVEVWDTGWGIAPADQAQVSRAGRR